MTPTVSNSFVDRNAQVIQEIIGKSAMEIMAKTSPVFRDLIEPSISVSGGDRIGRDLRFNKRYYGSLAGVIRGGNTSAYFGLYGDATEALGNKMYRQKTTQAWPDPREGPNSKPFGVSGRLHSIETNLPLTLGQAQLDATPANIKEHLLPTFKGFARNVAMWFANSFYADRENQFRLGTLGASTGTGAYAIDTSAKTIVFYPPDKNSYKYWQGQRVDIYKSTSTLVNKSDSTSSRARLYVSAVDDWNNKVTLVALETAEDDTAATFATWATTVNIGESAYVVYASTYDSTLGWRGLYGWRHFLKPGTGTNATNRILGSDAITDDAIDYIDVTQHPEFKSGLYSSIGSLNRNKLLAILDNVHNAFDRYGYSADALIAARGIWLNVFDQMLGSERINATMGGSQVGSLNSLGLAEGFSITHDGRTYKGYTDKLLERGTLVGLKLQNNWALLTPPDPQGVTRSAPGGMSDVGKIPLLFVMPWLTGTNSVRFPVLNSANMPTEMTMIPGYLRAQLFPENQIPGFYLTGITDTLIEPDVS